VIFDLIIDMFFFFFLVSDDGKYLVISVNRDCEQVNQLYYVDLTTNQRFDKDNHGNFLVYFY